LDNQPFEKLAEQAASGLKSDPELYLDVKQELCSHLEDKAESFAGEGKSEEESVELSCKSLGSPMDMAAELLNGNKQRMKLRSLMRLFLGGLIVPVAIVMAFGVVFWRYTRASNVLDVPTLLGSSGLFGIEKVDREDQNLLAYKLRGGNENAPQIRKYWETHRSDPDSRMYYAYYAIFLDPKKDASFVDAMRLGEKIEPKNALYNVLMADFYLNRGVQSRTDFPRDSKKAAVDKILDHDAFSLGIVEMRKAALKPYLYTYQMQILRKKVNSLPNPVLTEDYVRHINVSASELFPNMATFRDVSRRMPAAVRLLIADGHPAEAAVLMDTWKPYAKLIASESNPILIHCLVAHAIDTILSKEAIPIYTNLGLNSNAKEAGEIYARLAELKHQWRSKTSLSYKNTEKLSDEHGSIIARMLVPIMGDVKMTDDDLKPGRMHEHVMMEEGVTLGTLAVLALLLIGTLVQSILWLYRLRQAASVPILLMPPGQLIARALVFGIVVPVLIYWFYARVLPFGGRDYGLASVMWPRFVAELSVMALLILSIPTTIIRRYIRRRCVDLNIAVPCVKNEIVSTWIVRGATILAIGLVVVIKAYWINISPVFTTLGVLFAIAITVFGIRFIIRKRTQHGLYYGTLAKSLIPIYALSMVLISVTLQPLLLRSEASWLKKDKLIYGYLADRHNTTVGFTGMEQKATRKYWGLLKQALSDEPGTSK